MLRGEGSAAEINVDVTKSARNILKTTFRWLHT